MATTTPNFGWPVPTSTDLVKDGATAIEALGDSIDASLLDLKGGTTGQVLSKTSNTDMDFTWVTSDDANAIQNTIVDAKGDLIAASAADTPARLAVGSNGETLVADSSTSTGLSYQANWSSGKNKIINGDFQIWQRGTSSGSAGYQTADRWYENASNSTTFARESTTVPTGSTYCFKMTAGATAQMWIQQPIETLNAVSLAGQNITASAYVSASTSTGMSIKVYYSTATDNPAGGSWTEITATSGGTGTAVSGSFTRVSGVFAIPSTAKTVQMQVITTSTVASGVIVYVGKCQLEASSVATAFQTAAGTIQGELAACQRYYAKSYASAVAVPTNSSTAGLNFASAGATAASTAYLTNVRLPVSMRTSPTVTIYSFTSSQTSRVSDGSGTDLAAGSGTSNLISDQIFTVQNSSGGSITSAQGGFVFHYAASAEL